MTQKPLIFLLFCALLTAIGIAGGWFAANQRLGGVTAAPPPAEAADDGAHGPAAARIRLSPQTLENLGVTVAAAELTTFHRYREIPAVVTETPATYQPVFAPIGGRVQEIRARFGAVVEGGELMVTLIRDALPRPTLTLTEDVLKPATEEFHQTIGQLRAARCGFDILEKEMNRLRAFDGDETGDTLPLLPRKDLITLEYDLARARQELENIRRELRLHGLDDEEIAFIEGGKEARLSLQFWHDALIRNGLWPDLAEEIYKTLPGEIRDLPWTVATISELAAADLVDRDLVAWLESAPAAGRHFINMGGLLQAGSSLAEVKALYAWGALDPVVEIRAPAFAPDWDVKELFIKPGEKVEAGQQLLTLANPREMFLRVASVGGETAVLLAAVRENTPLEAAPLVPDTGPDLADLTVLNLVNEEASEGTVSYLPLANEPFKVVEAEGGVRYRSWRLRDGLRYMLRIPVEKEKLTDVYVVPGDAVTDEGINKVVFIQDGDTFRPVKVVVLYLDQDVAVLGKASELFPGDPVVQHGAFGLGLALSGVRSQVADEHAGHNH